MPNTSCTAGHSGELQWQELDWRWGWHPCKQSDYLGQNAAEGEGGPQVRSRFMAHGPLLLRLCGDKRLGGYDQLLGSCGAIKYNQTDCLFLYAIAASRQR